MATLETERTDNSVIVDVQESKLSQTQAYKDATDCVSIARNAFKSGKTRSIDFRKQQLKKLLQLLQENDEALQDALKEDLRRPKTEAVLFDIDYCVNVVQKMLYNLSEWCAPEKPSKPLAYVFDSIKICSDPYGVVLVIGTWNFPFNVLLSSVVGAIAAGNCVVMKPSEIAVASAKLIAELIPMYLDKECYHVYQGGVSETTQLLKERFDYIFFTGSTTVGKIVHAAANKHLTPVTLELGGKSPVYIDDSGNMELTVQRTLWGKCANAGQICIAPDYVLCTKEVQKKFIETAKKVLAEWYGKDVKSSPYYCRLISDKHFQRLVNLLKDKQNIAIGGNVDASERFMEPTILIDVNPNDPVMQEEVFGPILPMITIDNVHQAISFINAREKPLAFYIFTKNKKTKELLVNNTFSGDVLINDTLMHFCVDTLPFGGVGYSGMGNYHGKFSFDTFTHKKGVMEKSVQKIPDKLLSLRYPPYSDRKLKLTQFGLKPMGGGLKCKGFWYFFTFILGIVSIILIQLIYYYTTNKNLLF